MAEPSILKDHRSEAQIYIERVSIGAMVVALLFGLLLARVGYLQFVRYDAFVTRSDENRMQLVANAPSRGSFSIVKATSWLRIYRQDSWL